jgi:hypothetical protein
MSLLLPANSLVKKRNRSNGKRPIGPHSRLHSLQKIDGRTKSAALMRRVRAELLEHCGPHPSPVQLMLIGRACVLSLRLAQIDRKILTEQPFTEIDNNQAIAWQNALTRCLVALGVHQEAARNGTAAASRDRILQELAAE